MLKPLNNNVIVIRTEKEATSAGGIILRDTDQEKPSNGIVIASDNDNVSSGDTVMFGKYDGKEITMNGELVVILKYEEIIAKVVPDA